MGDPKPAKNTAKPINKWMKRKGGLHGLGGRYAHYVLRDEDGIYITTCGKANAPAAEFTELTDDELQIVARDPNSRCGKCHYSQRSYKPWLQ
jgi:hypothetical protein